MDIESPSAPAQRVSKILPIVSVCIGTFALCFQVFVLYPWHLQLSSQFADMQRICTKENS